MPAFRSIYIAGSYCRGDWLDCSSDLDICAIYEDREDRVRNDLQRMVQKLKVTHEFPSHCPGGIDYGYIHTNCVPKSYEEACIPSRYAPFSTTMFDLKAHHLTIYGEELNDILPSHPDPSAHAKIWLSSLVKRLESMEQDDYRLPFTAYKAITAAQLYFGEPSVNKYRMLEMYQKYVPDFEAKYFGEWIIRNYLGSFYPDRPPIVFSKSEYMWFITQLLSVV